MRLWLWGIAAGIIGFSFTFPVHAAELARVDDTVITSEAFANALKALGQQGEMVAANPDLRKKFLDHMVNSKLVAALARKEGFEKDEKYKARLADLSEQLIAGEYMDRQIEKKLTDTEVKKYFESHKQDFSKKEIKASHALLNTEDEAKKVLADVTKPGANFDDIAKKASKDPSVDLGFFGRGRMVPEFEKAAFQTTKGTIHPKPVQTPFGWHVIKVTDTKGSDQVDFTTVKEDVRKRYRQVLQEEMVHGLRDKSKIVLNSEGLKTFKMP